MQKPGYKNNMELFLEPFKVWVFANQLTNSSWSNKTSFQHLRFNCSLAPTNIYQNYSISPDRKLLLCTRCYDSLQSEPELLTTLNSTTILLYLAEKYPCGKRKAVILTVTSHYTRYYFTVYTCTHSQTLNRLQFRTACLSNINGNIIQANRQWDPGEKQMFCIMESIVGGCLLRAISSLRLSLALLRPQPQSHESIALVTLKNCPFVTSRESKVISNKVHAWKFLWLGGEGGGTGLVIIWRSSSLRPDRRFSRVGKAPFPMHLTLFLFTEGTWFIFTRHLLWPGQAERRKHSKAPWIPPNPHAVPARVQRAVCSICFLLPELTRKQTAPDSLLAILPEAWIYKMVH